MKKNKTQTIEQIIATLSEYTTEIKREIIDIYEQLKVRYLQIRKEYQLSKSVNEIISLASEGITQDKKIIGYEYRYEFTKRDKELINEKITRYLKSNNISAEIIPIVPKLKNEKYRDLIRINMMPGNNKHIIIQPDSKYINV